MDKTTRASPSARRLEAGEGQLLRMLMLEASRVDRDGIEHRMFLAETVDWWERSASKRTTSDRMAVFVLAEPGASTGDGMIWCLSSDRPEFDLGWTWCHPDVVGSPAAQALVEAVSTWARDRGASALIVAAGDLDEAQFLEGSGFVYRGSAADGVRPAYVRPCGTRVSPTLSGSSATRPRESGPIWGSRGLPADYSLPSPADDSGHG